MFYLHNLTSILGGLITFKIYLHRAIFISHNMFLKARGFAERTFTLFADNVCLASERVEKLQEVFDKC